MPLSSQEDESSGAAAKPKSRRIKKKKIRVNARQRAAIKILSKNPDITGVDLARAVGYKGKNPAEIGHHLYHSKGVQETMAQAMERDPDLNDAALRFHLKQGLKAQKKSYFAHEGEVKDEKVDDDFGTRFSYLNLAANIKGHTTNKVELTGKGGGPIMFSSLANLDEAALAAVIADLLTSQNAQDGLGQAGESAGEGKAA